jgi:hypothetical protein
MFTRMLIQASALVQNPLLQHIEIGQAIKIDTLEITWPGYQERPVFWNLIRTNMSIRLL